MTKKNSKHSKNQRNKFHDAQWNIKNRAILILAFSFIYYLIATLGLQMATMSPGVSPIWPATGLAIGLIYLLGPHYLISVALGAVIANYTNDPELLSSILIAIGNTLEAYAGAFIIGYINWRLKESKSKPQSNSEAELIGIILASLIAPVVSASIGVFALWINSPITLLDFCQAWKLWWAGDMLGALIVIPLLIWIKKIRHIKFGLSWKKQIKMATAMLILGSICGALLNLSPQYSFLLPTIFLVLLISQFTIKPINTHLMTFLISTLAIAITYHGEGPFLIGDASENLIHLHLFLASLAATGMFIDRFRSDRLLKQASYALCIGWIISAVALYAFSNEKQLKDKTRFNKMILDSTAAIVHRYQLYELALQSGVALHLASTDVHPSEWLSFVESLNLIERHPGINGLGVILPTQNKSDHQFERWAQRRGQPKFQIRPVDQANQVGRAKSSPTSNNKYIVTLIEPLASNAQALGLDVSSEEHRRAAADLARDTGLTTISDSIILVQDHTKRPGFLMYTPIYKKGAPTNTLAERRTAIAGWVYAPFITENFLNDILENRAAELELQIFSGPTMSDSRLIYQTNKRNQTKKTNLTRDVSFTKVTSLVLGQQPFTVSWAKGSAFKTSHDTTISWISLSCAIITFLAATLISSFQNITERANRVSLWQTQQLINREFDLENAQSQLNSAKHRFDLVTRGIQQGIWEQNLITNEFYSSPVCRGILGLEDSDPARLQSWLNRIHPADREAMRERQLLYLSGAIAEFDFEYRYDRPSDNTIRWLHVKGSAIWNEQQVPISMAGSLTDITDKKTAIEELKRSENKISQIMKLAPIGIILSDFAGKIIYANEWWESMGQNPDENQLLGPWFNQIVEEDKSHFLSKWNDLPDSSHAAGFEFRIKKANSKDPMWVSGRGIQLKNEMDESTEILCVLQDITKEKRTLSALDQALSLTQSATQAKSQFLANMSHEIRTPLNAIIGLSKLLVETKLDEEQHDYTQAINSASDSLLTIVNDVLDLSKIEANRLDLENISFNLNDIIHDVCKTLTRVSKNELVPVVILYHSQHKNFMGDPGRIRQIIYNLLSNAIKFTPSGKIDLAVSDVAKTLHHTEIKIEVQDTGIGIPQKYLGEVFGSFSQGDSSTTRKYGGTGLGLSISKKLIELMKGKIEVESKPAIGTKFTIILQLENAKGQASHEVQTKIANHNENLRNNSDLNILVAEDNELNKKYIQALLKKSGYKYQIVSNGQEAIAAIEKQKFDLILMDCQMPVLDGYEATRIIRSRLGAEYCNIPIIAVTAIALKSDIEHCYSSGMNFVIIKPVQKPDLINAINKFSKVDPISNSSNFDSNTTPLAPNIATDGQHDPTVLKQLSKTYERVSEESLTGMRHFLVRKDLNQVKRAASKLRFVASAAGLIRVSQQAESLERSCDVGDEKSIQQQIEQLELASKEDSKQLEIEIAKLLSANINKAS